MTKAGPGSKPESNKQRQLRVSPSEGERRLISLLAEFWGEGEATLIMIGFRYGLAMLMAEYEQAKRVQELASRREAPRCT